MILFVFISSFILFFDSQTNKINFHYKEKVLCCGDINAYESLNRYDLEGLFAYSFYLGNKYNYSVNYNIYNALLSGYELGEAPYEFNEQHVIMRIKNNIETKTSIEINKDKVGIKLFVDSCLILSKNGYFNRIEKFKMDSISWEISLHYFDKALQYENNIFINSDIWYFYILGYVNFKKQNINTNNWILVDNSYVPRFDSNKGINGKVINNNDCCKRLINSNKNIEQIDSLGTIKIIGQIPELPIQDRVLIDEIKKGSKLCYEIFKIRKYMQGQEYEMLLYALIMSNKYNYKSAYWDVYKYIWLIYNYKQDEELNDLANLDPYAKSLAEYYFNKALEFGDKRALRYQ